MRLRWAVVTELMGFDATAMDDSFGVVLVQAHASVAVTRKNARARGEQVESALTLDDKYRPSVFLRSSNALLF